jgi:hypothetical protein
MRRREPREYGVGLDEHGASQQQGPALARRGLDRGGSGRVVLVPRTEGCDQDAGVGEDARQRLLPTAVAPQSASGLLDRG